MYLSCKNESKRSSRIRQDWGRRETGFVEKNRWVERKPQTPTIHSRDNSLSLRYEMQITEKCIAPCAKSTMLHPNVKSAGFQKRKYENKRKRVVWEKNICVWVFIYLYQRNKNFVKLALAQWDASYFVRIPLSYIPPVYIFWAFLPGIHSSTSKCMSHFLSYFENRGLQE